MLTNNSLDGIALFNTALGLMNYSLNQGQQERQERIESKLDELLARIDNVRLDKRDSEHSTTIER